MNGLKSNEKTCRKAASPTTRRAALPQEHKNISGENEIKRFGAKRQDEMLASSVDHALA
jgi:hypothetical protein